MSYSDMRSHIQEMYGINISDGTINSITDRVIPTIRDKADLWNVCMLLFTWMLCILRYAMMEKLPQRRFTPFWALICLARKRYYQGDNESASFWLQVLNDLTQRGVEDILIASIDNLRGFADAIESIYPKTEVQLCVIHQIRNSMKYIPWSNQREFMADLKKVYKADNLQMAAENMDLLEEK
jgi:putative transposase